MTSSVSPCPATGADWIVGAFLPDVDFRAARAVEAGFVFAAGAVSVGPVVSDAAAVFAGSSTAAAAFTGVGFAGARFGDAFAAGDCAGAFFAAAGLAFAAAKAFVFGGVAGDWAGAVLVVVVLACADLAEAALAAVASACGGAFRGADSGAALAGSAFLARAGLFAGWLLGPGSGWVPRCLRGAGLPPGCWGDSVPACG